MPRYRLRGGATTLDPRLDRVPSATTEHLERYPLTVATLPPAPAPVVIGVNWYAAFDRPEQDADGSWWIGRHPDLGRIRGGHCVCLLPGTPARRKPKSDPDSWWRFYDQGAEGACVGFGCSRAASLMNRRLYEARWLYLEAQRLDEWPGEAYSGTSVRAGLEALRALGHRALRTDGSPQAPSLAHAIGAYRWTFGVDDVHAALGNPVADRLGAVPLLNSWGTLFPHIVWLPDERLDRLAQEHGEIGVVTDR